MKLKLVPLIGITLTLLAGCVRTPVLMELPDNEEQSLYGEAVGGPIGNGSFKVSSLHASRDSYFGPRSAFTETGIALKLLGALNADPEAH